MQTDATASIGSMFIRSPIAIFLILLYLLFWGLIIALLVLAVKALLKYLNSDKKGNPVIKKSLGQVIKNQREQKGMTQEFLAQSLGVSRQAVSKWETGQSEPSTSNLFALAKLFNMPIEEFMGEINI